MNRYEALRDLESLDSELTCHTVKNGSYPSEIPVKRKQCPTKEHAPRLWTGNLDISCEKSRTVKCETIESPSETQGGCETTLTVARSLASREPVNDTFREGHPPRLAPPTPVIRGTHTLGLKADEVFRKRKRGSILTGFTQDESDDILRLSTKLREHRPDLGKSAKMNSTSNRPVELLQAIAALQPIRFFSHCPKTSGSYHRRFENFSGSLRDRLRFESQMVNNKQFNTVAVKHTNSARMVATWVIPPRVNAPLEEWEIYNSVQQASWEDDLNGIYVPGLRLNGAALREAGFDQKICDDVDRGYELQLTKMPKVFHGKNYSSWQDYPETAVEDFEKLVEKRFIEGPLGYRPHLVTSLGMVIKPGVVPGTLKLRTCMDCTRSGLNDTIEHVYTKLDGITDALAHIYPGAQLSKYDLSDAFLHLPVEASNCEYLAFRNLHGDYYRYRFMPFGVSSAPWLCQRFTRALKDHLTVCGLQHVHPHTPGGTPNPAASYSGYCMAAVYIDDFLSVHPPWLSKTQVNEQRASIMRTIRDFGIRLMDDKCEGPETTMDFLGVSVSTTNGCVSVGDKKVQKLRTLIEDFVLNHQHDGVVSRIELSKLVGKLQFYAPYVKGAQACLATCYKARDSFCDPTVHRRHLKGQWRRDVLVNFDSKAAAALTKYAELLLVGNGKRFYCFGEGSLFWGDPSRDSDEYLDRRGFTTDGANVMTSDAAGNGGGYWDTEVREQFRFPPEWCAPHKSSNFREFYTIVKAVKDQAHRLRGKRLLFRTDNIVSMFIVRKEASNNSDLNQLMTDLSDVCREWEIDLAIRHISGIKNHLADRLSRHFTRNFDDQDWQFCVHEFEKLETEFGIEFDVDACADPAGFNARVPYFWSAEDSCLNHRWRGRTAWCNPPFNSISIIIQHFLYEWSLSPHDTSAMFVLPLWDWSTWWKYKAHFEQVRIFPKDTQLFTTPNWEGKLGADGKPLKRMIRGPTDWPVVVWYKRCAKSVVV